MVDVRSPLEGRSSLLQAEGRRDDSPGELQINHGTVGSLVQLAGWGAGFSDAIAPFTSSLGLTDIGDYRTAQVGTDCVGFWIAPQRLLIWSRQAETAKHDAPRLDPAAVTFLDLSHSRVCVTIEGASARDLMARLVTIDLRQQSFPTGAFAQTTIHHTSCLIFHVQAERYELLLPSSYARSLWDYIAAAARPFGLMEAASK